MNKQQTITQISHAIAEGNLSKAEDALQEYCNDYLVWAIIEHSHHTYEGFSLNLFHNKKPTIWIDRKEITLPEFYDLYSKSIKQ